MPRFNRKDNSTNRSTGKRLPQPDTFKTSDLIASGGKVDPDALLRAARAAAPQPQQPQQPAAPDADADTAPTDAPEVDTETAGDEDLAAAAQRPPTVTFRLTRDLDKRLDKYLTDRITFMSRAQLQRLIDDQQVTVNGRKAKASTRLRAQDVVHVNLPPPPSSELPEQDIPLNVMYEDQHIIVLNKTPDIIVHPARSELSGTLINALAFHFKHRSTTGGELSHVGSEFARPGVIHRLDRQTSGCIVFAKSEEAHWKVAHQFEHRTVEKRYVALVHGHPEPEAGTIDLPIGPHPSRLKGYREMQVVRHDHLGKPALTFYRTLGRYDLNLTSSGTAPPGRSPTGHPRQAGRVALVEIELKTGRTHQIRVHCTHNGWPLLADDMYSGVVLPAASSDAASPPLCTRVALHACILAFRHPITQQPLRFIAPFPADLRAALARLRAAPGTVEATTPPPGAMLTAADLLSDPPAA
jgi:23S rRNA pseudouridine1911/1915/1917 synthase